MGVNAWEAIEASELALCVAKSGRRDLHHTCLSGATRQWGQASVWSNWPRRLTPQRRLPWRTGSPTHYKRCGQGREEGGQDRDLGDGAPEGRGRPAGIPGFELMDLLLKEGGGRLRRPAHSVAATAQVTREVIQSNRLTAEYLAAAD